MYKCGCGVEPVTTQNKVLNMYIFFRVTFSRKWSVDSQMVFPCWIQLKTWESKIMDWDQLLGWVMKGMFSLGKKTQEFAIKHFDNGWIFTIKKITKLIFWVLGLRADTRNDSFIIILQWKFNPCQLFWYQILELWIHVPFNLTLFYFQSCSLTIHFIWNKLNWFCLYSFQ